MNSSVEDALDAPNGMPISGARERPLPTLEGRTVRRPPPLMKPQASAGLAGLCAAFDFRDFTTAETATAHRPPPAVDQDLGRPRPLREVNYVYAQNQR